MPSRDIAMRLRRHNLTNYIVSIALLSGCTLQQGGPGSRGASVNRVSRSSSQPGSSRDYGPSYTTFEEGGIKWLRGSMAFPTGRPESSGLLVEKTVPAEVLIGKPFDYAYKVSNLLDYPIQKVVLMDLVTGSVNSVNADPAPTETKDGVATWYLGTLGPRETKTVHVRGSSGKEGIVASLGWATYSPVLSGEIHVVRADMLLTASAPATALICEPIPVVLVIKNTGSSTLNSVKAVVMLPEGLKLEHGGNSTFEAGTLAPGQSREIKFNINALRTGKFSASAKATSPLGLISETSFTTTVHQPVLSVAAKTSGEHYAGRPFEVCFTVGNPGDSDSSATLEVPIPSGVSFKAASAGGRARGGSVVWDLGLLGPNSAKDACATFSIASAGDISLVGTVKGSCARPVSCTNQIRVVGVAAILLEKADDPDPIAVGEITTYTVKITNQGTADDTEVRTVVTLPSELTPVSATLGGGIDGQTISFPVVAHLSPKETITYKIVARGVKAGDGRTRFVLTSNVLKSPVTAEESTHVY